MISDDEGESEAGDVEPAEGGSSARGGGNQGAGGPAGSQGEDDEPLILNPAEAEGCRADTVSVPRSLTRLLKPHQRDGVKVRRPSRALVPRSLRFRAPPFRSPPIP